VLSTIAIAQTSVTKNLSEPITASATITALDQANRLVTIRNEKGEESTLYAGPDIKRFAELKVGQKVQLRYYRSVVYTLAPANSKTAPLTMGEAVTPGKGAKPGGTVAVQMKATVEVVSVDPSVPSITVRTAKGQTITRLVQDAKNLANIKAGDHIDITYTEAAILEVQ
jgi:hypothetical protein